jgi:aspartate aminotransferase
VVTIFSASQSYAMMGWRVGFALAPAIVVEAMQTLQGPITAAAPHLSQLAAVAAFGSGAPKAMMEDYRERRELALRLFSGLSWMAMQAPASGPYLWGDMRRMTTWTPSAFPRPCWRSRKWPSCPATRWACPGFIRLGYISDDVATLREGIRRIIEFGGAWSAKRTDTK